jgi:hypothetical protein
VLEKAIEKLKAEMEKNKDSYVQIIGNYLEQYIKLHPEEAEKILGEGKTIAKSLDEMTNAVRKKAVNGRAMLTDQEGYEIVLKYFGINGQASVSTMAHVEAKVMPEIKQAIKNIDFDVSLDDFI